MKNQMRGLGKKPALMAPEEFDRVFSGVSKSALIDALWCAAQLGVRMIARSKLPRPQRGKSRSRSKGAAIRVSAGRDQGAGGPTD
jgi:hypothetical protein